VAAISCVYRPKHTHRIMIPDLHAGSLHLSPHVPMKCADFYDDSSICSDSGECSVTEFDESLVEMEELLQEYSIMGKTPALAAVLFDKQGIKSSGTRAKKSHRALD
jgi:hypothetical protein